MLYRFDPCTHALDGLVPVDAQGAGVVEKQLELALACTPHALFKTTAAGDPVLILKKSVPGKRMPDIIALDGQGRLILVECKRSWATRDALAQLLDYAAEYAVDPWTRLRADWASGEGKGKGTELLTAFRQFAEDEAFDPKDIAREHSLVVVAAARDDGFQRIAKYLEGRGVPVHFVTIRLYRRSTGDLYLDVDPVDLRPEPEPTTTDSGQNTWMINTDEAHSKGAWERFLEQGVAAIWGYPDGPATLQQGQKAGDTIYAYLNGRGIVARGRILDPEVRQPDPGKSVIPECDDGNEWQLAVAWTAAPGGAVSNADVRRHAGAGLPVRNTYCRLWNPAVRRYLEGRWA